MLRVAPPAIARKSQAFSATAWLRRFVEIGGGYALTTERKLWLVVDHCPNRQLEPLVAQIIGRPDRQEQIKRAIETWPHAGSTLGRASGEECRRREPEDI